MSRSNSKLTARGRLAMVKRLVRGESGRAVAAGLGLAVSNVYRWWARYREEGAAGLADRTSRPLVITVEMQNSKTRLKRCGASDGRTRVLLPSSAAANQL
ncbi:helix-turn-helix domain-containing protein [Vulcanimicrobium alpinum]|uniref:helix-turn-helix domain-containing protein n=1 Tax=Vulcanimicrobium alpinum TaxID=3016050 RepID=UPI003866BE76